MSESFTDKVKRWWFNLRERFLWSIVNRCVQRIDKMNCGAFMAFSWGVDEVTDYNVIADAVEEQPTVDAVPVVRCRQCKYFVKNTWECVRLADRFGDEYSDARVYPEYYCADGERRTE